MTESSRVLTVPEAEIIEPSRVPRVLKAQMTESSGVPRVPISETTESSRVPMFVSPVQPALLPGSPHTDGFHVLIIGLPQGREQGRVSKRANTPARQSTLKYPILRRLPETTRNCHT